MVQPTGIARTVRGVGTLESPQSTQISAEVGGKVTFLDVPEGARVEAGRVLARLDEQQARAEVSVARARYQNARKTIERLQKLRSERVISEQELDDATAELDSAEGQLEEALTRLDKMTIRAPFTGVLGLRQVSLGAFLEPGDPIARLTQVSPLHLVFSVPQHALDRIHLGQHIRGVVGSCGERFAGEVSVIEPFLDPQTRMFRIQAIVANEEGRLRPGMAVTLKVEVETVNDALMIPQESVIRRGPSRLVFTVAENRTAAPRKIVLGEYTTDQVEVVSGLRAGDQVVALGHQKLQPGAKVEPHPYSPIENPNLELGATRDGICEF